MLCPWTNCDCDGLGTQCGHQEQRHGKKEKSMEMTGLFFTTIEHPVFQELRGLSVKVLVQSVVKKTDAYLYSAEHLKSLRWLSTIIICTHTIFEDKG